jgi:hemin uptake protein HemP
LLKGSVEIVIEHHGREYRLRVTQNGKLILTA